MGVRLAQISHIRYVLLLLMFCKNLILASSRRQATKLGCHHVIAGKLASLIYHACV